MTECNQNTYLFRITCIDKPGRMISLRGTFPLSVSPLAENDDPVLQHSKEIKQFVEESDLFKTEITMNNEFEMNLATQSVKLVELSLETEEMIIKVVPNFA